MEGERIMFRKRPQSKLGRGKRTQQVGKGPPRSPLPRGGADYRPYGRRANPRGAGTEIVIPSWDLQQEWRTARWGTAKPLGKSVWTLPRRGPRSPSAGRHHLLCPSGATLDCHLCGGGDPRPAMAISASLEGWPPASSVFEF